MRRVVYGPRLYRFVEEWRDRARLALRFLDIFLVAFFVGWQLGLTSFWTFLAVLALWALVPALYGWMAGRKITADHRAR